MHNFRGIDYDVIVVGSGAGGGMAAYELTRQGQRVLMLEAGRDYDPYTETPMFQSSAQAPLLGTSTPDKNFGFYDATVDGGWEVPGEPYTMAEGSEFMWWRSRMLGGRTNHWGRFSLRFSQHDFKGYSRDGLGADWPLDYADLSPWYDKTEKIVGVCGDNPGIDDMPDSGPGVLQPPPAARVPELLVQAAGKKLGIPVVPMHRAVLTRPLDERQACFYATPCGRGCSIGAAFQTTTSLIPMAKATGKLGVVTDAMVERLEVDANRRISGVSFIDKPSGKRVSLPATAVVLAASACETARILLNSKSEQFPQGLANSSGQVGKNLLDSTGVNYTAHFPNLKGRPRYNEDGHTSNHLFIPWWGHAAQARGELNFARGYHFEMSGGFTSPGIGIAALAKGYGIAMKKEIRERYGSYLRFALRGEMLPSADCYMELDDQVKDKWGIPVPKFHWRWSEQEYNQALHGRESVEKLVNAAGGEVVSERVHPQEMLKKGGQIIHEVGTTRMGSSAQSSVTNHHGQTWDCSNLTIMDGGVFASNPHKNCTLTIMTLAMKNAAWLAGELERGRL